MVPIAPVNARFAPPGNAAGFRRAKLLRELIFGPKTLPSASGTFARSRGIDTIDTVRPTGSSETTIIESVSASVRPGPESTPISRILRRSLAVGAGAAGFERTPESAKIWPNIAWAAVP